MPTEFKFAMAHFDARVFDGKNSMAFPVVQEFNDRIIILVAEGHSEISELRGVYVISPPDEHGYRLICIPDNIIEEWVEIQ